MPKFTDQEQGLFNSLEDLKRPHQETLDGFNAQLKDENKTIKEHKAIRVKIFNEKKLLVPFAEMQAGLANPKSRDKYFPDLSKNAFLAHVIKICGQE